MYQKIIDELNNFLLSINIPSKPLNPKEFQGVFIKKLSNQNIVKDKRRIPAGDSSSNVNQTHIDITGHDSMLFFSKSLSNKTTQIQSFDVDIFFNNYEYLKQLNPTMTKKNLLGDTIFVRSVLNAAHIDNNPNVLHSSAYKKLGHSGKQVQLNIPDSEEAFTKLRNFAFEQDALVMLRYDYLHYLAIIIPNHKCGSLYDITETSGGRNVNVSVLNPSYNETEAKYLQSQHILSDIISEDDETIQLQQSLYTSSSAGTDIEKLVKARISQGAFRRLLLLTYNHKCCLCNVTTTSVLRASHIKEWKDSSRQERMDSNNGLLLCANHDALFDRHIISFDPENGNICISKVLDQQQKKALHLSSSLSISLSDEMKSYMQIHHKKYTDKENG